MNTTMDTEKPSMWTCATYSISILAANAADFCARRFAAANRKGADVSVSISRCRTCRRGRMEFELARYYKEGP